MGITHSDTTHTTHDEGPLEIRQVAKILVNLMSRVTEKEVTAQTVNAACNCAAQLTSIMRVHLDAQRLKMETAIKQEKLLVG